MAVTENLEGTDAMKKIKELIDHERVCHFVTRLNQQPLSSRPMSTVFADPKGILWFFSETGSEHNQHIEKDGNVQLFYANPSKSEFLSVAGKAEIVTDRAKIEELWTPWAKTWLTEGKDDPRATLIKVTPTQGYYWDTQHNKVTQLAKIAVGAVLGKTMDDGVTGKVKP